MYRKGISSWRKHWDFMLMDFIFMQLCILASYEYFVHFVGEAYQTFPLRLVEVTLLFSQVIVILFTSPFKNVLKRSNTQEFARTVSYVGLVFLVELFILFIIHEIGNISRLILFVGAILYGLVTLLSRIALKTALKRTSRATKGGRSVVAITTRELADGIVKNFDGPAFRDMRLTGLVLMDENFEGEEPDTRYGENVKVVGNESNILDFIAHGWVDEVFINLPPWLQIPDEVLDEIYTMGITVHLCVIAPESAGKLYVERFGNYSVLTSSMKFVTPSQMFLKRIVDILGGVVGCLITILIMIFVGPLIFIKSPGPIFFKQTRVGRNGKTFKMFKFRSMYMDAEARKAEYMKQNKIQDGLMFKMDDDPRIIGSEHKGKDGRPKGIGNFIRNTSLDEFPQFFNVLKGDMSIVGTRPPTLDEWERYDLNHRVRMSIKPGITGLWQTSGRSKITDFDEVVRLDSEYIRNWTLWEDIEIIFKTIKVVLTRDGAE